MAYMKIDNASIWGTVCARGSQYSFKMQVKDLTTRPTFANAGITAMEMKEEKTGIIFVCFKSGEVNILNVPRGSGPEEALEAIVAMAARMRR